MKIYIVHYETLEDGYKLESFSNRKKAISRVSNLKREDRKKHKDKRRIDYVGLTKEPKIITKDFPITREGLLTAINYI